MKQCYLLILFSLAVWSNPLLAQTSFSVTSSADSGPGTLRQAITLSNSTSTAYAITITTSSPISLTAVLPAITRSCTIIGASTVNALAETGGSIIERSSGAVASFRLLNASTAGTTLYLQDLILQGGVGTDGFNNGLGGGGVLINGGAGLTMLRCVVRKNTTPDANGANDGGGVQVVNGPARIINSMFRQNSAPGDGWGGALRTGANSSDNPHSVTMVNCAFVNNSARDGGGLFNAGTTLLINCSFLNNSTPAGGGGAFFSWWGTVSLLNCVVWNTTAGSNPIKTDARRATTTARYCLIESGAANYTNEENTSQNISTSPFSGTGVALNDCSPAIDAGENASYTAVIGPATDLANQPRFFSNGRIDIGAVEFQGARPFATITQQPPSSSLVCQGSTVMVGVSAMGRGPFTYQWYRTGLALSSPPSALSATLTLIGITTADAGSYSVVVTGFCNSVTSTAFDLTVTTPIAINLTNNGPLSCNMPTATLTTTPGGQGTYVFSASAISQGTNTAVVSQTGVYSVRLTSAGGCSSTAQTSVTANDTPPTPFVATQSTPDGLVVQVSGGVSYERVKTIDRINGYEIRQTEINSIGYFLITQRGPYSITVIGANGCRATVTGTL